MNGQSPLTVSSSWTKNYLSGLINMKNESPTQFKKKVLKYKYALDSTEQIMNYGDNSMMKFQRLSEKEKKLKKTTPLFFEDFTMNNFFLKGDNSSFYFIILFIIFLLIVIFLVS